MIINTEIEIPILLDDWEVISKKMLDFSGKSQVSETVYASLEFSIRKSIERHRLTSQVRTVYIGLCCDGYEKLKARQVLTVRVEYSPNLLSQDARLYYRNGSWSWNLGPCCRS